MNARLDLVRQLAPAILTLALLLAFASIFAQLYFGDSHSPYGTCYASNGRAAPCKALQR
jgi:hypothetical protein